MKAKIIIGFMAACLIYNASPVRGADSSVNRRDGQFVRDFLKISGEVQQIAQLAQTQSQDGQLRNLSQDLLRSYSQAGQQVAATARALGLGDGSPMSASRARQVDKLASLSGPAFDKAASHELFKREEAGVRKLSLELNNGSGNIGLRQLAALLQVGTEPDLWQTTQVSAQLNRHP